MEKLTHVAQSGHWDMTVGELLDALGYYFNVLEADVVEYTEVSPPKFRKPLRKWCKKNHLYRHHPRGRGRGECMTVSRIPIGRLASHARLLSKLRLKVGRTAPTYLKVTAIKGWGKFRFVHTPAHTGGLKKFGGFAWPTRVYMSVMSGLRRFMDNTHGYNTAGGDVNLDLGLQRNLELLGQNMPGLKYAGRHGQKGDLGNRLITGVWTNLTIVSRSQTLDKQPGHDHGGVITVLGQRA